MESPPSFSDASPPFNNLSADTVLCSSDNVHFHVHSVILAEASPFFKDMFALPQPPPPIGEENSSDPDSRDGHPIIRLTEDSSSLDSLLRLCYPIADPELSQVQAVTAVLEAAMKYQMEAATTLMVRALEGFALDQPLRVWAIACRLGFEKTALSAAKYTLSQHIQGVFLGEMQDVSAGAYYRLLEFHRRKGVVTTAPYEFNARDKSQALEGQSLLEDANHIYSFTSPPADIICRSSDGSEFRVHQVILSMTSSVVQQMVSDVLQSPDGIPGASADLPVLDFLDVDGRTLAALLKLCYYAEETSIVVDHSVILRGVLRAAKKFQMQRVIQSIEKELTRVAIVHPLRTYLIAAEFALDKCARLAARHSISQDVGDMYILEMESAYARPYFRLLVYHQACAAAVSAAVAKLPVQIVQVEEENTDRYGDESDRSDYYHGGSNQYRHGLSKGNRKSRTSTHYQWAGIPQECQCSKPRRSPPWLEQRLQTLDRCPGAGINVDSLLSETFSASETWCTGCKQLASRLVEVNASLGTSNISKTISAVRTSAI